MRKGRQGHQGHRGDDRPHQHQGGRHLHHHRPRAAGRRGQSHPRRSALPMSLLPAASEPTGEQIAEEEWRPHEYSVGHARAWAAGRRSSTRLDNKESTAEARQMSLRRLGRHRHANTTGFRTLEAMTCVSGKLDLMSVKQTVPIFNLFIVCRINSFNP